MSKLDQQGGTAVLIALVITVLLLIGSLIFGVMAYSGQQNYKNNADALAAKAVKIAVANNSTTKDKEFNELQKSPVKTYNGPGAYGSVVLKYPKSWSAYVDASGSGSTPVDGYFNPGFVSGTKDAKHALRLQVTSSSYDNELSRYDGLVQQGAVKVTPFAFAKVKDKDATGVKIVGKINETTQGTVILVPLRDKALKLWTETNQFQSDFNKYVLPDFSFSP